MQIQADHILRLPGKLVSIRGKQPYIEGGIVTITTIVVCIDVIIPTFRTAAAVAGIGPVLVVTIV